MDTFPQLFSLRGINKTKISKTQSIHVSVRQIWPIDQSIWVREIQITPQGQRRTTPLKCNQSLNISLFEICNRENQITEGQGKVKGVKGEGEVRPKFKQLSSPKLEILDLIFKHSDAGFRHYDVLLARVVMLKQCMLSSIPAFISKPPTMYKAWIPMMWC